jgi:hypothetical protein
MNRLKIEGVVVIAKFVQNFNFKLDPLQSFDVTQELTLRPIDGTKVCLMPR